VTAQGEDLLAWLTDAIARRESAASAASPGPWVPGGIGDYGWTVHTGVRSIETEDSEIGQADAKHIALNSPSAVLRRCAADRKLIAAHPITRDVIVVMPDGTHGFGCSVCHNEDLLTVGDGWCDTLLALAEGYGWTGGER
jgi:hypothetical protein